MLRSSKTSPIMTSLQTFPKFADLPTDIQACFWELMAFQPRDIPLWIVPFKADIGSSQISKVCLIKFKSSSRAPKVLQINRASRHVGMTYLRKVFKPVRFESAKLLPKSVLEGIRYKYTWVNTAVDRLVPLRMMPNEFQQRIKTSDWELVGGHQKDVIPFKDINRFHRFAFDPQTWLRLPSTGISFSDAMQNNFEYHCSHMNTLPPTEITFYDVETRIKDASRLDLGPLTNERALCKEIAGMMLLGCERIFGFAERKTYCPGCETPDTTR